MIYVAITWLLNGITVGFLSGYFTGAKCMKDDIEAAAKIFRK